MTFKPERVIPASADVVVVGGGSAGAAAAGAILEHSTLNVVLVEAGPDYGPKGSGYWPEGLLDPAIQTFSHDWGYHGLVNGRVVDFPRAQVLGGCSAINGAAVVHGSRHDYDGWAAAGNRGWSAEDLRPIFASAWKHLHVRHVSREELTPFQIACIEALVAAGVPEVADLNDLDQDRGVAPFPTNTDSGGIRMNAAFGYLDPHRDRGRLTVIGDAPAVRVQVEDGAARGVVVLQDGEERVIQAPRVVVSGGAYGSPAVLQRSGIGPASVLGAAGIPVLHELQGVGRNLHDQPTVQVDYSGTAELSQLMRSFPHTGRRRDEQVIAKFGSSFCEVGFDLHIFPVGGPRDDADAAGREIGFTLGGAVLTPLSRGFVEVTGPSPEAELTIDHRYLSDPQGRDLARLVEVVNQIRKVAAAEPLRPLIGTEVGPAPGVTGDQLAEAIASTVVHYYHPAGSCKMGPASDTTAVVDERGAVHGLQGLFVADASVMPSVVSGNTNMPTIVIGEKVGRSVASAA
jgi:choline dehydrogenase